MQYKLRGSPAIGRFFVTINRWSASVTVNYICGASAQNTTEATLVLQTGRLLLGLSINFYINPWIAAVGIGWCYGMMAFFSILPAVFLIVLMVWGLNSPASRRSMASSEASMCWTRGEVGGL